mgnify:CR=1 FL=1
MNMYFKLKYYNDTLIVIFRHFILNFKNFKLIINKLSLI